MKEKIKRLTKKKETYKQAERRILTERNGGTQKDKDNKGIKQRIEEDNKTDRAWQAERVQSNADRGGQSALDAKRQ